MSINASTENRARIIAVYGVQPIAPNNIKPAAVAPPPTPAIPSEHSMDTTISKMIGPIGIVPGCIIISIIVPTIAG